jgi:cytoskeletal protein CcmA (bactofilin family)
LKNSIPTEKNFADLVDGMINQKDDGLVKLPGEPLSLEASGDRSSLKKVINFYEDFASSKPAWTLSLNPRLKPADQATAKPGWNLSDGDGTSRLFIARSGMVGVGTVMPLAPLDVAGLVRIGGAEKKSISFARDDGDDADAGTIAYKASWASTTLSILGAGQKPTRKISLYDDVSIIGGLTIAKEVKIDGGLTIAKEVKIDGGLTIAKEVKIDGGLTIAKEVKINGGLSIAKEVKIDGGLTIAKEVKIDGGLTIAKEVKIDGGLTVKKNLEIGDLKITVATGMLNVGGMVQIGASKKISFTRDTDDEANAGTIAYKPATESDALSIMGAGKDKKRKIVLRDEVAVGGGLEILKESNPLQFTTVWTEYPDDKDKSKRAEISNDTTGYKTLMIVGNRSAGLKTADGLEARRVGVWDRLDVNGELFEKLTIIKCNGSNNWKNADHPLRKYFKERLKGEPKGTILHAMGDHPDWKDAYWVGMVGNDGLLRMAYTRHQEMNVIA